MNNNNNNQQIVYVTPAKSRTVYIIFGLFFGGLGIHDFYAGDSGKGVLKIIISFLGSFLFFGGFLGTTAAAITGDAQSMESISKAPLVGLLMLGIQSLYILYQIITVKDDAQGRPFC